MSVRCCERAIAQVRAQVGKGKMVYGLSRGVNSSDVAVLLLVRQGGSPAHGQRRQTRSSVFSGPAVRGMAAIVGNRSSRSLTKAT